MIRIDRRAFLKISGALAGGSGALAAYAGGVEPCLSLELTKYELTPPGWSLRTPLKVSVIADIHVCEPYMSVARLQSICDLVNASKPDLVVMLGDFNGGHVFVTRPVEPAEWVDAVGSLTAPLGVWAILGNHDWWHGPVPGMRGDEGESVRRALRNAHVRLLENSAVRLTHGAEPFWIVGLADQLAYAVARGRWRGADDLSGSLAQVSDAAPVVLLAHEPMIFNSVPDRVSLTLCGHTHGGQINVPLLGSPYADRRFGSAHVYGHVIERDRHMIISAGLGESIVPVRFLRPPELVEITLLPDGAAQPPRA